MKAMPLILAAGLLAAGSLSAHNHEAEKSDHKKMSAEQMDAHHAEMMQEILKGDWRDPKNPPRDVYRHPAGTLAFFGVNPHSKVIEIWPGGGWYAEILVPYVTKHGSYTGAVNDPAKMSNERSKEYYAKANQGLRDKFAAKPDVYGKAKLLEFDPANAGARQTRLGRCGADLPQRAQLAHGQAGRRHVQGLPRRAEERRHLGRG